MSTSLVISIAFFVGAIVSYELLKNIIRSALRRKRKKRSVLSCTEQEFKNKVLHLCKSALRDYDILINEMKGMEETLKKEYGNVIEGNKGKLDKELNDGITANIKQATDQLTRAKEELEAKLANAAANSVKSIINKNKNNKRNSEVIATLSRSLSKKLH
jgi:F-type H+-transporting ATPase subunit b